jgi:uracil-DNA glycosylase family 4
MLMIRKSVQEELGCLHKGIRRCRKCPLYASRKNAVPGEGLPSATAAFVGEAPGREEDEQGRPFIGRSGRFLDSLLESIGISRHQIYITSAVKCRPPENRAPHVDELRICKINWLDRQIFLVDPKVIVLLGSTALKQMAQSIPRRILVQQSNISRLHGRLFEHNGRSYVVSFHPAAAMRFPQIKEKMKNDFKILKNLI